MRRWGTPQNFYLVFIDELGKQLFIKKTVEVAIKCKNFNTYNAFKNKRTNKEKDLEISSFYTSAPKILMI